MQILREQPLELARREVDARGNLGDVARFLARTLHNANGRDELFVGKAKTALNGHPLPIPRSTDAWMNELLRHVVGERAAIADRDQLQHHVERRRTAGASAAITVDH